MRSNSVGGLARAGVREAQLCSAHRGESCSRGVQGGEQDGDENGSGGSTEGLLGGVGPRAPNGVGGLGGETTRLLWAGGEALGGERRRGWRPCSWRDSAPPEGRGRHEAGAGSDAGCSPQDGD